MRVFNASIEQLLWPEKRERDTVLGDKVPGVIDRTTARSEIRIPAGFVPDLLRPASGPLHLLLPQLFDENGDITIGPIPAGVPVNLLSNLRPISEIEQPDRTAAACRAAARLSYPAQARSALAARNARPTRSCARNSPICAGPMLELSKCPGFRGQSRPLLRDGAAERGAPARR